MPTTTSSKLLNVMSNNTIFWFAHWLQQFLIGQKPHYKGNSVIGRCTYMLPVFTQTIYDYLPLRWWMPGRTLNWLCTIIVSNFEFAWNKAGQSHSLIHFGYAVMFGIHTTLCHLRINIIFHFIHINLTF